MASLRRLAKDHASLRTALPPNYLFPPSDDSDSLPDDLTQLSIHMTGSVGTPYSSGLWLLHLRIPHDYPKSPPKATFKTRIFHPNVEETTGTVCLETLKRDWDPKLTLKDILVTISCLLIQPNPDSALNEKAGVLVREDYDGFVRQARLMTKIHAPIPAALASAVDEARCRGEERESSIDSRQRLAKSSRPTSLQKVSTSNDRNSAIPRSGDGSSDSAKENSSTHKNSKGNDNATEIKKPILGKRPRSDLMTATDCEGMMSLQPSQIQAQPDDGERPRKSPKHTTLSQANGSILTAEADDKSNECVTWFEAQNEVATVELFTQSTQPAVGKARVPTKYRTYARIGIKRL